MLPVQQAEAVAIFAPLAIEGANIIFDLSIAGLVGAGVIAADTEIKKSDQYKFVMSYLSYCTDKELDRLADLASTAGEVATSAISDLLALMLGTFGTATIDVQNYGTMPSWLPPPASFMPSGMYYYFIELLDDPTDSRYIKIIYHGSGVGYSVSHSSADFSGCIWGTMSYRDGQAFYFTPDRILSTGAIAVGTVLNPGIDLSKPISLTDTFAIPADVQTCDDSWANDDTYKVAYPPWLADMDVAGDVVINPSLEHAGEGEGDIGGDVTGDLTADGSAISGAITGLWDWLKGILQSILDAIKAIPGLITGLLQSIWDAVKSLPAAIAAAFSAALTAILDAVLAIPAAIASIFDVSQFSLDFSGFKNLVIKDKFPFCIPWDFYNAIKIFAQSASDYQMNIDLETSYFEVHHTVDLSPFLFPIAFFRYASTVWFAIVLILRTRDLMKW